MQLFCLLFRCHQRWIGLLDQNTNKLEGRVEDSEGKALFESDHTLFQLGVKSESSKMPPGKT